MAKYADFQRRGSLINRALASSRATVVLTWATLFLLPVPATADPPVVPLPEDLQKPLALLGEGVLGAPLPARPITDPAKLRHLAAGTWLYRVVAGPSKGTDLRVQISRVSGAGSQSNWRVTTGDEDIQTLQVTSDNEVVKVSQDDLGSNQTVLYKPALVLDPGMKVGESKTVDRKISTHKTGNPGGLGLSGTLNYTTRYVGAYRITTPAGTFDTRLLEHRYDMKVGPANAFNQSWSFYADGIGSVAQVATETVKAVLVYHRSSKTARVLLEPPKNQQP